MAYKITLVHFTQRCTVNNSLDHAGGFTLSNEWRGSSHDSFGTTDIQSFQEEPSELRDEPLKDIIVVHHFGEGNEEDDGSESVGEEPEFLCPAVS